jgi:hypothetical protein
LIKTFHVAGVSSVAALGRVGEADLGRDWQVSSSTLGKCSRLALEVGRQGSHFQQELTTHVQMRVCCPLVDRLNGWVPRVIP